MILKVIAGGSISDRPRQSCVNNRHICFVYRTYFMQSMIQKKMQGECKQSQEAIHHSAYVFFINISTKLQLCSFHEREVHGRGIKTDNLYHRSPVVSQPFLSASMCRQYQLHWQCHSFSGMDWNDDNVKRPLQKDTRLRKSRKLK